MDRRQFIKGGLQGGAGIFLANNGFIPLPFALATASSDSPIADLAGPFANPQFTGDEMTRPHDAFWDLEGYIRRKGGRPSQPIEVPVVIVGGGMSGLLSAYHLRDLSPVVLEMASQFGGNSRAEKYRGTSFTLGTAYITVPDPNSSIDLALRDLGLNPKFRHEGEEDARVHFAGALKNLWTGETDPAAAASAKQIQQELARILEHEYPDIPWTPESQIPFEKLKALDGITGEAWLRSRFPSLHPHVLEYFQLYCWSSFGASLEEISAAQFLNFVASETQGILAFPGGNAAITEALYNRLRQTSGKLISSAMTLEVKKHADGKVDVLFEDRDGNLKLLRASAVVMATPKYVAKHLVKDVSPEQKAVWSGITYRAYVVVNVLLKKKIPSQAFDIYCLEGKVPPTSRFGRRTDRPVTDICYADWANHDRGESGILTVFRPYPFDGARSLLTSGELAVKRITEDTKKALTDRLAAFGTSVTDIEAVRVTHWGHALPMAQPGGISKNLIARIEAPVEGNIFFANQDNYLNPAFESCFAAAENAARAVRSVLT